MNDSLNRRYDVTVTVARDGGGPLPDPAAYDVAAEQAAAVRRASGVMSAPFRRAGHHRGNCRDFGPASAVAVALAVVAEALRCPAVSPSH